MPKFFHELSEAKELFETLAVEKKLISNIAEKDYWVMHCLWGLMQQGFQFEIKGGTSLSKGWCCIERFSEDIDVRFNPPDGLNTTSTDERHVAARFSFYDKLAEQISIPGITVERNPSYDDEKARNGGISLNYESYFSPMVELKSGVLLEVGFDTTAPNEPRDFSSWVLDKALAVGMDVINNRALGVKCFNPEYTFVDKLQTISRRFRQHSTRNEERDHPRNFLRHYYDLYRLLEMERVKSFIGTDNYLRYKQHKLRGEDLLAFQNGEAFRISNREVYKLFDEEFNFVKKLIWSSELTFKEVIEKIRSHASDF